MTKPIQTINRYKADLREFQFLLFEQFKLGELLGKAPFEAWGPDEVKTSIAECYRFAREVLGPLNVVGDIEGCKLEGGNVITPTGFKDAWKKLYDAGCEVYRRFAAVRQAAAPRTVQNDCRRSSLRGQRGIRQHVLPGLAYGAAEVIAHFGTPEQKKQFAEPMLSGTFGGDDVPHRTACGNGRGVREDECHAQSRRQLLDPRHEDLHLGRRP